MMLMTGMPLVTMKRGLTRKERELMDEVDRRAAQIVARIESTGGFASIALEQEPHWHAAVTYPQKERIAGASLADRGFGICIPEYEVVEIRRGRAIDKREMLLPGYVLFFAWNADNQLDRIRACEGVHDVLLSNGHVAVVPDEVMNLLRIVENTHRPLNIPVDATEQPRKKGRQRQSRNPKLDRSDLDNYDVVAVHSFSPFVEAMRSYAGEDRLGAFHKALGLDPCAPSANRPTR